jgi:hypothetical protein
MLNVSRLISIFLIMFGTVAWASWASAKETAPTEQALPTTETLILADTAAQIGCPNSPSVQANDPRYMLTCLFSEGHWTTINWYRYPTAQDAANALGSMQPPTAAQALFHGYPAAAWRQDQEAGSYQYHVWAADRWLAVVIAFDDFAKARPRSTPPLAFSEALFSAANARAIFPKHANQ